MKGNGGFIAWFFFSRIKSHRIKCKCHRSSKRKVSHNQWKVFVKELGYGLTAVKTHLFFAASRSRFSKCGFPLCLWRYLFTLSLVRSFAEIEDKTFSFLQVMACQDVSCTCCKMLQELSRKGRTRVLSTSQPRQASGTDPTTGFVDNVRWGYIVVVFLI